MSNAEQNKPTASEALFVKMVFAAWNAHNASANKLFDSLTDQQFLMETAPGKNTGIYLLGHLAAASDDMLRLLGFGEQLYPQLQNVFINNPDKSGLEMPSVAELREYWKAINNKLNQHISQLQPTDWFTRHMAVSEEDFVREPHRNRLNIVISRTNHLQYHTGQIALLKKRTA